MLDYRVNTFLELCNVMNYRKTADRLFMTQPAVTQHIQYLEEQYGCKLFNYENRKLSKTDKCHELESLMRSMVYSEQVMIRKMRDLPVKRIAVGATKTIGEYTIQDKVLELVARKDIELHLIIDNTEQLMKKLNNFELDILMLEGYFDKSAYDYQLIRSEELVGICSKNHRFARKRIEVGDLFPENLILREQGSGTRSIFEHFLREKNYTTEAFADKTVISSYKLIEQAVKHNLGISFVYRAVAEGQTEFETFRIARETIRHEFNYVYLKNTSADEFITLLNP